MELEACENSDGLAFLLLFGFVRTRARNWVQSNPFSRVESEEIWITVHICDGVELQGFLLRGASEKHVFFW